MTDAASPSLDRFLADLSPEQATKVKALFADFRLNPDDPIFHIMLATNQVAVLLADGPKELSQTLQHHQGQLNDWSTQHLHMLHALSTEVQALKSLAEMAPQAQATAERLHQTSTTLSEHLEEAETTLTELLEQYRTLVAPLHQAAKAHLQITTRLEKGIARLERQTNRPAFLSRHPLQSLGMVLLLIVSSFSCLTSLRMLSVMMPEGRLLPGPVPHGAKFP